MFRKISPYEIDENVFRLIDKDWMLITAGKAGDVNTMTASWGHLGIMWNLPVAICYIRPQRHTFDFANRYDFYTLSFFTEQYRGILKYCGTKSGRDHDKIQETGLIPLETKTGNIYFQQARLVMECRKIYQDDMVPENFVRPEIARKNYPKEDYHRFYYGEIINVWESEG
ncbi:MAG: flavin reductase [Bacteroidales bacterium]|nr:flavin reductase [Bacteroidales bacterium]